MCVVLRAVSLQTGSTPADVLATLMCTNIKTSYLYVTLTAGGEKLDMRKCKVCDLHTALNAYNIPGWKRRFASTRHKWMNDMNMELNGEERRQREME